MRLTKKLIMESLPSSQVGRSVSDLYSDVSNSFLLIRQKELTKSNFLQALSDLDKEQSLVIFKNDDIRGTNHGFVKYGIM